MSHFALFASSSALLLAVAVGPNAWAAEICQGYGPQAPRDISSNAGTNARIFTLAPAFDKLNLCNIHSHTNAEHKGPGFSVSAGTGENGGFKCNESASLTPEELENPAEGYEKFHGVKPGDTIEVHWVYSSCDVKPGKGLDACLSDKCSNPELRVESQVFLVVNDPKAANFNEFGYEGTVVNGLYQAKQLPAGTGDPVVFAGSTTGDKYSEATCSPLQVTWSVRPFCTKLDFGSLQQWAETDKVFEEGHSHGVRQLVTAPELLSPIN